MQIAENWKYATYVRFFQANAHMTLIYLQLLYFQQIYAHLLNCGLPTLWSRKGELSDIRSRRGELSDTSSRKGQLSKTKSRKGELSDTRSRKGELFKTRSRKGGLSKVCGDQMLWSFPPCSNLTLANTKVLSTQSRKCLINLNLFLLPMYKSSQLHLIKRQMTLLQTTKWQYLLLIPLTYQILNFHKNAKHFPMRQENSKFMLLLVQLWQILLWRKF